MPAFLILFLVGIQELFLEPGAGAAREEFAVNQRAYCDGLDLNLGHYGQNGGQDDLFPQPATREIAILRAKALKQLCEKNQYQQALQTLDQAKIRCREGNHTASLGDLLILEANLLLLRGYGENALRLFRRARKTFASINHQFGQAFCWESEGNLLRFSMFSNLNKTVEAFRQAQHFYGQLGMRNLYAQAMLKEGEARYTQAKFGQALAIFSKLREKHQSHLTPEDFAEAVKLEGLTLLSLQDIDSAVHTKEKLKHLAVQAGPRSPIHNKVYQLESRIGLYLGDSNVDSLWQIRFNHGLDPALAETEQLFKLRKMVQGWPPNFGQATSSPVPQPQPFMQYWEPLYQKALNLQAPALLAPLTLLLGQFQASQSQPGPALAAFRKARVLAQKAQAPLVEGACWVQEARLFYAQDKWGEALNAIEQAVPLTLKSGDFLNTINLYNGKLIINQILNNNDQALKAAHKIIALNQQHRQKISAEHLRLTSDSHSAYSYHFLLHHYLDQKKWYKSLHLFEQLSARSMRDFLFADRQHPPIHFTETSNWRRWENHLAQIETDLNSSTDFARRAELKRLQLLAGQSQMQVLATLLAIQGKGRTPNSPLKPEQLRQLAAGGQAFLIYYYNDYDLAAGFLLTPQDPDGQFHTLSLPHKAFTADLRNLNRLIANPALQSGKRAERDRLRAKFWQKLLAPFAANLPSQGSLTIFPSGRLQEMPFEILQNARGTALFERLDVAVVPSASVLAVLRQRQHQQRKKKDTYHHLTIMASEEDLAVQTDQLVQNLLGTSKPFHLKATHPNYLKHAPLSHNFMFIGPARHKQGSRAGTYLKMLPTLGHDSRLSAFEIANIPLQSDLVILVACETSYGRPNQNNERLDLTRAFLIAGANAVLATRWRIPNHQATFAFVRDFCGAYWHADGTRTGMRKDQALTHARKRSRGRGHPMQVWAAWVLVGVPD